MSQHWVFLHGWGMTPTCWRALLAYLPPEDEVTCLALPGHGDDLHPADWHATLVRYAAQTKPAIWVGWSLGGLLACEFAKQYPHLVQRLVLIGTNPHWLNSENWPGMDLMHWQSFRKRAETNLANALQRFAYLQGFGQDDAATLAKQVELTPIANANTLLETLDWLTENDLRPVIKELTMPVLFLLGELDPLVPVTLAPMLRYLANCVKVVIMRATSHNPMYSHPQGLSKQLIAWSLA